MLFGGSVAIVASIMTLLQCFTQIPAGHVGVIDFYGVVSETTLKSGVNLINPMACVIKMSLTTRENKENMDIPVKRDCLLYRYKIEQNRSGVSAD